MNDTVKPVKASGGLNQDRRRLKRARMTAGLTIREASRLSGCSTGTISTLENGKASAHVTTLAALAGAYGCKITDLMPPEPKAKAVA